MITFWTTTDTSFWHCFLLNAFLQSWWLPYINHHWNYKLKWHCIKMYYSVHEPFQSSTSMYCFCIRLMYQHKRDGHTVRFSANWLRRSTCLIIIMIIQKSQLHSRDVKYTTGGNNASVWLGSCIISDQLTIHSHLTTNVNPSNPTCNLKLTCRVTIEKFKTKIKK